MRTSSKLCMAYIALFGLIAFIGVALVACSSVSKPEREPFYDGEGNVIPDHVVRLYVKANFVHMTKQELDSINTYFEEWD